MTVLPGPGEWDVSALLAAGREYLGARVSFEDISADIVAHAVVHEGWIEPYRNNPGNVDPRTRQICFRVGTSYRSCDLFYNAPDGLRGRYWQAPECGDQATRHLIDLLRNHLLTFASDTPLSVGGKAAEMHRADVEASLSAPSAKVWIRESTISIESGPQLLVRRWEGNESKPGNKVRLWRWTPYECAIDLKGALVDPVGTEHVPDSKRDRAHQIHCFGFT